MTDSVVITGRTDGTWKGAPNAVAVDLTDLDWVNTHFPARTSTRPRETHASYTVTRFGWHLIGHPTPQQFAQFAGEINDRRQSAIWALGRSYLWSLDQGEEYAQPWDEMTYSRGYLDNLASMCRQFPEERCLWLLSTSHYQAVMGLDDGLQDNLLALAELWQWSRDTLRAWVKELKTGQPPTPRCLVPLDDPKAAAAVLVERWGGRIREVMAEVEALL